MLVRKMMRVCVAGLLLVGGAFFLNNIESVGSAQILAQGGDGQEDNTDAFFEAVIPELPNFAIIAKNPVSRKKFLSRLDEDLQAKVAGFFDRQEDEVAEFIDALTSDPDGFKILVASSESAMNLFRQFQLAVRDGVFDEELKAVKEKNAAGNPQTTIGSAAEEIASPENETHEETDVRHAVTNLLKNPQAIRNIATVFGKNLPAGVDVDVKKLEDRLTDSSILTAIASTAGHHLQEVGIDIKDLLKKIHQKSTIDSDFEQIQELDGVQRIIELVHAMNPAEMKRIEDLLFDER